MFKLNPEILVEQLKCMLGQTLVVRTEIKFGAKGAYCETLLLVADSKGKYWRIDYFSFGAQPSRHRRATCLSVPEADLHRLVGLWEMANSPFYVNLPCVVFQAGHTNDFYRTTNPLVREHLIRLHEQLFCLKQEGGQAMRPALGKAYERLGALLEQDSRELQKLYALATSLLNPT